ncbi:hypothetical protein NL676_026784 [Syzygium grande]|nr:hypothetical protein NL676_026784 [Syzygium grande]
MKESRTCTWVEPEMSLPSVLGLVAGAEIWMLEMVANLQLAFTKAWKDACSSKAGASTISVPHGKKYHLNPINFVGPCKSYINLAVSIRKIIAPKDPNAWKGYDPAKWLTFENVNGLNISGPGLFDGYGNAWWNISCKLNPKPVTKIQPLFSKF